MGLDCILRIYYCIPIPVQVSETLVLISTSKPADYPYKALLHEKCYYHCSLSYFHNLNSSFVLIRGLPATRYVAAYAAQATSTFFCECTFRNQFIKPFKWVFQSFGDSISFGGSRYDGLS